MSSHTTQWASYQISKTVGCACAGIAGNVFPVSDFKGDHTLAIPPCITALASRTCRDSCRDRLPVVAGKMFPAVPAHAQPQFYVSGKRPMATRTVRQSINLMTGENLQSDMDSFHDLYVNIGPTVHNAIPRIQCHCIIFMGKTIEQSIFLEISQIIISLNEKQTGYMDISGTLLKVIFEYTTRILT